MFNVEDMYVQYQRTAPFGAIYKYGHPQILARHYPASSLVNKQELTTLTGVALHLYCTYCIVPPTLLNNYCLVWNGFILVLAGTTYIITWCTFSASTHMHLLGLAPHCNRGTKLSHSKTKSGHGPHRQGCCTISLHLAGGRRKYSHTIIIKRSNIPSLISLSIL